MQEEDDSSEVDPMGMERLLGKAQEMDTGGEQLQREWGKLPGAPGWGKQALI